MKKYIDKNVYDSAVERINYIFDNFPRIYVSFSSGKDSGVLLNLAIDIARSRKRKIGVLFIDLEAYCSFNIDFVERMFKDNSDVLDPYWVCLPMESPNGLSYYQPTWIWWEDGKDDIWVRPMPTHPFVLSLKNNPMGFYTKNMPFESFIQHFGEWYGQGEKTACLLGLRTDESLNRFRAIASGAKERYQNCLYSTKVSDRMYNFSPIYDWNVEDVWVYNAKFNKDYNKIYDLFYKAGVSIHKMRVDEPFGNEAKAGLSFFRVIEPQTWGRVVNRVSGANFGNIYSGSKIMSARYTLPKNHTWKSFTKFLLSTLPPEAAKNYKTKFIKFIKYWNQKGCPVNDENISILEDKYKNDIVNTGEYSLRGTGDKYVVKFKRICDEIPELDTKSDFLTWKRMAMCIIKNDFICKSLSFSITKDLTLRQKELMDKYKNL